MRYNHVFSNFHIALSSDNATSQGVKKEGGGESMNLSYEPVFL